MDGAIFLAFDPLYGKKRKIREGGRGGGGLVMCLPNNYLK